MTRQIWLSFAGLALAIGGMAIAAIAQHVWYEIKDAIWG